MNYSISDILDRVSILRLKLKNSNCLSDDERNIIQDELQELSKEIKEEHEATLEKLYYINGMIWKLESDIRSGKEGELGLEEVGRRALMIRDFNKVRISIKNSMNDRFKEIKIDHASGDKYEKETEKS